MASDDSVIASARINAYQAITVALITGAVTILTTLLVTGNLLSRDENTKAGTIGVTQNSPALLNAPVIHYRGKRVDLSLNECMDRARVALKSGGFTGTEFRQYVASGFRSDYAGSIWCHTDVNQVIFVAAGRDTNTVEEILVLLERGH